MMYDCTSTERVKFMDSAQPISTQTSGRQPKVDINTRMHQQISQPHHYNWKTGSEPLKFIPETGVEIAADKFGHGSNMKGAS